MESLRRMLRWDAAKGGAAQYRPMLIALGVMLALVLVVALFNVPNPNLLLLTALAVLTSLYGIVAGAACGVVMLVYSVYLYSADHSFFRYTALDLQNLGVVVMAVALNILFIGNLRRRQGEALSRLSALNQALAQDGRKPEAASVTDDLTGARNRFALRRDYARFENKVVHVMMLDIDAFKAINERFGRAAGDHVLRMIGRELSDVFGAQYCYRYGGDEFLVIVPDVPEGEFLSKLEALKSRVREVEVEGNRMPVHFSAGYVYGVCELSYDLRLMMHQADSNLYDAKSLGKDCSIGRAFSRAFAEALPENADGFGEDDRRA